MFRLILLLMASNAMSQNVPSYPRSTDSNQDMGGINQDFKALSRRSSSHMTTTVTPASCPAGQSLTGAFYSSGSTTGGTCTAFTTTTATQTFSGATTFSGAVSFSSAVTTSYAAPNTSTVTANGYTKNNGVGAWAIFVGTNTGNEPILGSYNVATASRTTTGTYQINFGVPFAGPYSYTCTCAPGNTGGVNACKTLADGQDQTASSVQIGVAQAGVGAVDTARVTIICVGAQ